MKIACNQPNYIPWYPFFHLIQSVDKFFILDVVKPGKKNYIVRNKIISNNLVKYSKKYTNSEIKQIIMDLKNIDLISKTSNFNHKNLLTILIVKICYGYYR